MWHSWQGCITRGNLESFNSSSNFSSPHPRRTSLSVIFPPSLTLPRGCLKTSLSCCSLTTPCLLSFSQWSWPWSHPLKLKNRILNKMLSFKHCLGCNALAQQQESNEDTKVCFLGSIQRHIFCCSSNDKSLQVISTAYTNAELCEERYAALGA